MSHHTQCDFKSVFFQTLTLGVCMCVCMHVCVRACVCILKQTNTQMNTPKKDSEESHPAPSHGRKALCSVCSLVQPWRKGAHILWNRAGGQAGLQMDPSPMCTEILTSLKPGRTWQKYCDKYFLFSYRLLLITRLLYF